jgi:uncharacterized protein (DUF1015 family)
VAEIKPFRALRPVPEKAAKVASAPYDVVAESEVRQSIEDNPLSFLRITRTEAEFAGDATPEEVFERSRQNLQAFITNGVFITENAPSLYVYRLKTGEHEQTGVVACCSLDEYEKGLIKKHEKTRPDKVADRTEHLLAVRAQTGLILLAFRGTDAITKLMAEASNAEPLYDYRCIGGVQHTFWRIDDAAPVVAAFQEVPSFYIADGHHRVESADVARRKLRDADPSHDGTEEYNYVLAGVFPAEELRILAYNRIVTELNGLNDQEFLDRLKESFVIAETDTAQPSRAGEICMYLSGKWYRLNFAINYYRQPDPVERLDVTILHDYVLRPILGIEDERTDRRISFIGGKYGADQLKQIVDEGAAQIAFSLYPTSMNDLLEVSDRNEIMPPKSTWFEPKLKDGILVHVI